MISQADFNKTVRRFSVMEDARDLLWNRAMVLLQNGYEIEAYILILATWNFAGFRFFLKKFDLNKFQKIINNLNPIFRKINNISFRKANFEDKALQHKIRQIYRSLKEIVSQTGASKLMALKNHNLFVMWDTEIRKMYKIDNSASPEQYINFLVKMQDEFKGIKWTARGKPLAKAIDEYNYVLAERRRKKRS